MSFLIIENLFLGNSYLIFIQKIKTKKSNLFNVVSGSHYEFSFFTREVEKNAQIN